MNNIELENKIKELLSIENYFDMIVAMKKFEPEYKKSDFFKETKMSLDIVVKQAKIHYALQLNDVANKLQKLIGGLDLTKINELISQWGEQLDTENTEIRGMLEKFKDLQ